MQESDMCKIIENRTRFGFTEVCNASVEEIEMMKSLTSDSGDFPLPALCLISLVLGIVGNGLVLLVIINNPSFRNMTNTALGSLAIANILFLVVTVPITLGRITMEAWNTSRFICIFSNYIEIAVAANSVWHLVVIGAERYIVIVHPFKARQLLTRHFGLFIIIAIWVFSFAIAIPTAFSSVFNQIIYTPTGQVKDTHWKVGICVLRLPLPLDQKEFGIRLYYILHTQVLFVAPFLLQLFCYVFVIKTLWFSVNRFQNRPNTRQGGDMEGNTGRIQLSLRANEDGAGTTSNKNYAGNSATMDKRKQVIIMLILVVILFFVTWSPKFLLHLVSAEHRAEIQDNQTDHLAIFIKTAAQNLPFVQSCLNPLIYVFVSRQWRTELRSTLTCRKLRTRNRSQRNKQHSMANATELHVLNETN